MQSVDLCALLPKDVEDEFILEDAILEANPTDTCESLHGNGLPRFHPQDSISYISIQDPELSFSLD